MQIDGYYLKESAFVSTYFRKGTQSHVCFTLQSNTYSYSWARKWAIEYLYQTLLLRESGIAVTKAVPTSQVIPCLQVRVSLVDVIAHFGSNERGLAPSPPDMSIKPQVDSYCQITKALGRTDPETLSEPQDHLPGVAICGCKPCGSLMGYLQHY